MCSCVQSIKNLIPGKERKTLKISKCSSFFKKKKEEKRKENGIATVKEKRII